MVRGTFSPAGPGCHAAGCGLAPTLGRMFNAKFIFPGLVAKTRSAHETAGARREEDKALRERR